MGKTHQAHDFSRGYHDDMKLNDILEPGTKIRVRLEQGYVRGYIWDEYRIYEERLEKYRKQIKRKEDQQRVEKEWQMKKEAEEFNNRFDIPVKWVSGIKVVLSGLSERSNGTGTYKNTVTHVLLKENLREGRLRREKGDFLCGQKSKAQYWFDKDEDIAIDPNGNPYNRKITCKQCLKIMERWRKDLPEKRE